MGRFIQDLYFMHNCCTDMVKIGVSKHPALRKVDLEMGAGVPLEILGILERGAEYEEPLHLAFAADRRLGEWFAATDEILGLASIPHSIPRFVRVNEARIEVARVRLIELRSQAGHRWRSVAVRGAA